MHIQEAIKQIHGTTKGSTHVSDLLADNTIEGKKKPTFRHLMDSKTCLDICHKTFNDYTKGNWNWDEYNRKHFNDIALWFNNDTKGDLDIFKGLLLYGPNGCGKSTFLNFFSIMSLDFYKLATPDKSKLFEYRVCTNVFYDVKDNGGDSRGYHKNALMFDELAKEGTMNSFGNSIEVMDDILCMRADYDQVTIVATNETPKTLGERYGGRLYSRIHGNYNLLRWGGDAKDYRI